VSSLHAGLPLLGVASAGAGWKTLQNLTFSGVKPVKTCHFGGKTGIYSRILGQKPEIFGEK